MKKRFKDETEARNWLKAHKVSVGDKTISNGDYGIGTWGAIDYLINYHKYNLRG